MPAGLRRTYGVHHLHFITCSCYHRMPKLRTVRSRDRFLSILEETRQAYRFVVVGYVVMLEHFHLLISEPEVGSPSTVMQVLKQRTARALLPNQKQSDPRQRLLFGEVPRTAFWQARFYDFNVWTSKKRFDEQEGSRAGIWGLSAAEMGKWDVDCPELRGREGYNHFKTSKPQRTQRSRRESE